VGNEGMKQSIEILGIQLQLLPEKAIFVDEFGILLVSDVHLGKSETFQAAGVPIASLINQETIDRLLTLCQTVKPKHLIILGDLFHSRLALVDEVLDAWSLFLKTVKIPVSLLVGNHDRRLVDALHHLDMECCTTAIQINSLILSHEPNPQPHHLNICGHIHPCFRIKTRLDQIRLPCFYYQKSRHTLILPSFGSFTGGYEMKPELGAIAYVIAEGTVIPFTLS
jgi:uncharacterized protein